MPTSDLAPIVTALLRDGDRVLLCHRSPRRLNNPDVWDLPGGHVEPGEPPGEAVAREVREELGVEVAAPTGPPLREFDGETFHMRIWLFDTWTGTPANIAPDEHDAIGWFRAHELDGLRLAHESYPAMLAEALAARS